MYTIEEKTLDLILKKRFGALVGTLCERIEILEKEDISKDILMRLIKKEIKKDAYNTMRNISDQISSFSEGVKINVQLYKPTSK